MREARSLLVLSSLSIWKPSMMINNTGGARSIKRSRVSKALSRVPDRPSSDAKRFLFRELDSVGVSMGMSARSWRTREYVSDINAIDSGDSAVSISADDDRFGSLIKNETVGIRTLAASSRHCKLRDVMDVRAALRKGPTMQRIWDFSDEVQASSLDTTRWSKRG